MKHYLLWLVIISLVLIGGIAGYLLNQSSPEVSLSESTKSADSIALNNENHSTLPPELDYCELADNPEKYNDKIVRLKADLFISTEGSWFADPKCGINNGAFVSSKNLDT